MYGGIHHAEKVEGSKRRKRDDVGEGSDTARGCIRRNTHDHRAMLLAWQVFNGESMGLRRMECYRRWAGLRRSWAANAASNRKNPLCSAVQC